ncbi:hypothetical protein GTH52_01100 [Clostridium tyrobutyricum]|uniref:Uncharacterized protein n=1 Tax=Clostridium tyrobutyricum DIVETGP TaxID=1408889 RepID=W6NA72_CLOTY|nr:hypothetical protein [Clostridium tyrobutyricum]AND85557.1 hypothetical protein CTK_C23090 [Clostridium tyrobutyricum]ANP70087.1 hypothetical protein BA182_10455 [Clostridium tyrobutyricum]MBV4434433.1 hypothetical protein [Clostridium tyrobutyricum]QNB65552.1 hypothetical protein GTH52_01100 [Clostridium tyrobutyricum]CDL92459.1 hypothetical protein CTDIVETGP_2529 [Clostridium tyrobutyricum DIVETGP]
MGIYTAAVISPKGNSGMTLLSSHNDDSTVSFPDIGFDFFYNGTNCRTAISISGNSWVGFTGAAEQLKINRRDAGADNIYYAKETVNGRPTFRIRWEGHQSYSSWGILDLVWELILFDDSAMVLVIDKIPNTGTNSFANPVLGTTALTLENSKSYAFIPGQEQGKAYTVKEGSYIQTDIKYLIADGSDIKHWDSVSESYVKVSELPLTAEKFQTYGDDVCRKERTGLVYSSPVLKIWSPSEELPAPKIIQTIVPKPVIVRMLEDISFSEAYIQDITNVVLTVDSTGSGIIAFIVSTDSGVSWKVWDGSSWILVDITNMQDVKSKGMSAAVLQGISEAQWTSLGLSDKRIRFAWYMEVSSSTDILKLKELRINYSLL